MALRTKHVLSLIRPIAPVLQTSPFNDPAWLFEPKYDGFRGMVYLRPGACAIYSKRRNVFIKAGLLFLCALHTVEPAVAQNHAPAELLAAYVREYETPNRKSGAFRDLIHVLSNHGDYSTSDLEAVLEGLEHIALTGTPPRLRAEAAAGLAIPGSDRAVRPIPGSFSRIERVYRRSNDPVVRSVLVSAMGDLVERGKTAQFLGEVATRTPPDFAESPEIAVQSLLRMGDEGRVVLKRLHESGGVRDPKAKLALAHLAKNGYRRP